METSLDEVLKSPKKTSRSPKKQTAKIMAKSKEIRRPLQVKAKMFYVFAKFYIKKL